MIIYEAEDGAGPAFQPCRSAYESVGAFGKLRDRVLLKLH